MANTGRLYAIRGDGAAQVSPDAIKPGTLVEAQGPAGLLGVEFSAADAQSGAYRAGPEVMAASPAEADPIGGIITEARAALGIGDHEPDPSARRWGLATTSNVHGGIAALAVLASIATMTAAAIVELSEEPPKELEYQPVELVRLSHPGKGKSGAKGAEGAKRSEAKPDFRPPSKGRPIGARVDPSALDFIPSPKDQTKPVNSETVGASQYGVQNLNRGTGGFGSGLLGQGTGGGGGGGQGFGRIHGLGKVDTGGGIGVDTRIEKGKIEPLECLRLTANDCGTPRTALGRSCPKRCTEINRIINSIKEQ